MQIGPKASPVADVPQNGHFLACLPPNEDLTPPATSKFVADDVRWSLFARLKEISPKRLIDISESYRYI